MKLFNVAIISLLQIAHSISLSKKISIHQTRSPLKRSVVRPVVDPVIVTDIPTTFEPRGVTAQDTAVFIVGCSPFAIATVEFWRRIAVGEPFGTGSDSVIIGEDDNPESSRGRRILGKDAFIAAYVLFGIAGLSLVLTFLSGLQLLN